MLPDRGERRAGESADVSGRAIHTSRCQAGCGSWVGLVFSDWDAWGTSWWFAGCWPVGCVCLLRLPEEAVEKEATVVQEPAIDKAIRLSFVVKQDFASPADGC